MPIITFKTITQQSFELELNDTVSIAEVKERIQTDKGENNFPIDGQKLIYNGKVLDDTTTVGELNIPEKKFIVVMVTKKPSALAEKSKGSVIQKSNQDASGSQTKEVGGDIAADSVKHQDQPTTPSLNPEIPQEHVQTVDHIQAMGYPRDKVIRALRAAFFDADRAVEYLCNGLPQGIDLDNQVEEQAVDDEGGEGDEDPASDLAFLAQDPQFQRLRHMVQQNPAALQQVIQQIATTNHDLMNIIQNNQEEFLALLNDPSPNAGVHEGAAGAEQPQPAVPQRNVIMLTSQDREAIERLKAMGFPEGIVVEAYLACDKNEDLAANYILQRMDEEQ